MIKHKIIYAVLDTLLIIGALAVVATIDGGKWIATVAGSYESNFYDPKLYEPELYESKLNGPDPYEPYPPAVDGSDVNGVNADAETSTLVRSGCLVRPARGIPEWFEINQLLAATSDCT